MGGSKQIKNGWIAIGGALALILFSAVLHEIIPGPVLVPQYAFVSLIVGLIWLGNGYYRRSRAK